MHCRLLTQYAIKMVQFLAGLRKIKLRAARKRNCRCCFFQTPSVVHCMNATASAQSPKFFTKFLPANNFCQLLRVTRKRSCTSAGNTQAQLHFRDDQQRAFGISNLSNCGVV